MAANNAIDRCTNDLVTLLARGISQRRMYFDGHPKVQACATETAQLLKNHLKGAKQDTFFLGVAESKLVHDGKFLVGPTIIGRKLVEFAELLQCGGFLFRRSMQATELLTVFSLAAELNESTAGLQESRALLKARGIEGIHLSPPYEDAGWFGQFAYEGTESNAAGVVADEDLASMLPVYQSLFDTVHQSHGNAGLDRDIDVDAAQAVTEKLLQTSGGNFTDIMQIVRYPDYDSYTVGHSVRVALLAVIVGRYLGLDENALAELAVAGLLHDVGKAKIPDEILFKKGRLDAEERRVMETHPALGAELLLESEDSTDLAVAVAFGHHRRHDGGGYPQVDCGPSGAVATQLIHVCDVFEAVTAVRPYKTALTPRRAYEFILSDRKAFEPTALAAFAGAIGLYPPGSRVRLSDGRQAMILRASVCFDRPSIQITHASCGTALADSDQLQIDLSRDEPQVSVAEFLIEA